MQLCVILVQQQIICTWLLMVPSSWKQQMCLICSLFLTLGSSNILLGTSLQRYLSFVDLYPDRNNLLIAVLICSDKIIGITYCHVLFFTPQKVTDPYISLFHCFSYFMVSTNVIFPFSIAFYFILWCLQMYELLPSAKWSFWFVTNLNNFRHLRVTRNLISRLVLCNIAELSSPGMMMSRNVRKSWGESSLMIRLSLIFSLFLYIFVIISLLFSYSIYCDLYLSDAARWA